MFNKKKKNWKEQKQSFLYSIFLNFPMKLLIHSIIISHIARHSLSAEPKDISIRAITSVTSLNSPFISWLQYALPSDARSSILKNVSEQFSHSFQQDECDEDEVDLYHMWFKLLLLS